MMNDDDGYTRSGSSTCSESCKFLKISLPASLSMFLNVFVFQSNVMYMSRSGDPTTIAAMGLGFQFHHMLVTSVVFFTNGALDTLVSQAFGAKDLVLCG
jgi:Na+-driven multidrug efflux pump